MFFQGRSSSGEATSSHRESANRPMKLSNEKRAFGSSLSLRVESTRVKAKSTGDTRAFSNIREVSSERQARKTSITAGQLSFERFGTSSFNQARTFKAESWARGSWSRGCGSLGSRGKRRFHNSGFSFSIFVRSGVSFSLCWFIHAPMGRTSFSGKFS